MTPRRAAPSNSRASPARATLDALAAASSESAALAVGKHPCYTKAAYARYARLHLPVAPRCNVTCAYCDRRVSDCLHATRPGLSARVLAPAEVPALVREALHREPRLRVIGVAGPGEPLANPETFEAFALARAAWVETVTTTPIPIPRPVGPMTLEPMPPTPVFCLSTNGLLLPEAVPALVELGVAAVTVTLSAVTPEVAGRIYLRTPRTIGPGPVPASARPAASPAPPAWLIDRQLAGIRRAAGSGLVVKVNTVLIPGVNMGVEIPPRGTDIELDRFTEIRRVAKAAAQAGAYIHNIIPLIPLGAFAGRRAPTCAELRGARDAAGRYLRQFRLCRQCRADALGVPAEEL